MRSYFTAATTATYNYTFTLVPQSILKMTGDKTQIVHKFDDGSVRVASLSSQSYFEETLVFDVLTAAEQEIIFDLWHNSSKANGRENTFYWLHPLDGYTYVVRFMDILTIERSNSLYSKIAGVIFRIEGYKA